MDTAALFLAGAGTGLLAGATTCAAVQLGLLTGAVRDAPRPTRPVTAFLTAKLISHTALGAALGLAGSTIQPGPRTRGAFLATAALLLTLFALDLLGFPPARRLLRRRTGDRHEAATGCHPPGIGNVSKRSARRSPACAPLGSAAETAVGTPADAAVGNVSNLPSTATGVAADGRSGRPVVLGVATLLVPCGLTLTAELAAVTSRSAWGGAAVMAGFVLGTVPVFGLVGVTIGRTMALLRGRLSALLGVGLLALAAWTLMSGLRLGGWLPEGGGRAAADSGRFVRTEAGTQVVSVWALDQGYRPALLDARAGVRTVLEMHTEGTTGHTRAFTIPSKGLDVVLPSKGTTRIDLGTPGPGRLRFVCASGHYPGAITFRR
ncbi:sulfite exporter TauE/SafE family protein [Actinomadura barringtoniae]|uniref:Sulfite exporter TauE/SafE family protein n=1 Tax=Actinomadura barringtoniae TaxID=1427535 RepID=A0A939T6L0_9ACTN|nr:sulfite exporter TauE/SafE family protein [Actinomadura barringtoniae]MBO2455061.1 sulfite exporter TauE/SafE family protein [Actinomadura barringtoniae]